MCLYHRDSSQPVGLPGITALAPENHHPATQSLPAMRHPGTQQLRSTGIARSPKIWQLRPSLHCPIIGTCLTMLELRQLAIRVMPDYHSELTDFEVHVRFVANADSKNAYSIRLQKQLDQKHKRKIREIAGISDPSALVNHWKNALEQGDVPGSFWAVLSHQAADATLRERMRQDVHMLSHQIGAGQHADLAELHQTRFQLQKTEIEFKQYRVTTARQREARERHLADLRNALGEQKISLARLRKKNRELETHITHLQAGSLHQQLREAQQRAEFAERELARILARIEPMAIEKSVPTQAGQPAPHSNPQLAEPGSEPASHDATAAFAHAECEHCANAEQFQSLDLNRRCILCVGGRATSIAHFRHSVTRQNGSFQHHDGGIKQRSGELKSMLGRADAVICAIDCVSHAAYQQSKRLSQRLGKPCILLRSSSASAFNRALITLLQDFSGTSGLSKTEHPPSTLITL